MNFMLVGDTLQRLRANNQPQVPRIFFCRPSFFFLACSREHGLGVQPDPYESKEPAPSDMDIDTATVAAVVTEAAADHLAAEEDETYRLAAEHGDTYHGFSRRILEAARAASAAAAEADAKADAFADDMHRQIALGEEAVSTDAILEQLDALLEPEERREPWVLKRVLRNCYGTEYTPLMLAAKQGRLPLVKGLLQAQLYCEQLVVRTRVQELQRRLQSPSLRDDSQFRRNLRVAIHQENTRQLLPQVLLLTKNESGENVFHVMARHPSPQVALVWSYLLETLDPCLQGTEEPSTSYWLLTKRTLAGLDPMNLLFSTWEPAASGRASVLNHSRYVMGLAMCGAVPATDRVWRFVYSTALQHRHRFLVHALRQNPCIAADFGEPEEEEEEES